MKKVLRPVLLFIALTFSVLALTKYLLSDGSVLASLPRSFIEWCVAIYSPQSAEEVADMEIVVAIAISTIVTSALACLALLLRKWVMPERNL